jgi:hypothetical protein
VSLHGHRLGILQINSALFCQGDDRLQPFSNNVRVRQFRFSGHQGFGAIAVDYG